MSDNKNKHITLRSWISGLVITVSTIVAYFAFWHLSPKLTFIIGCLSLFIMIIAMWFSGENKVID